VAVQSLIYEKTRYSVAAGGKVIKLIYSKQES